MDNSAFGILFILILVPIAIFGIAMSISRPRTILERWADANGFQIVHAERRTFFRGPFFWRSTKDQVVYYVTVRDSSGAARRGYVRCGGWVLGLMSDAADVQWDD
jgi:hypothetical protein